MLERRYSAYCAGQCEVNDVLLGGRVGHRYGRPPRSAQSKPGNNLKRKASHEFLSSG